MNNMKTIAFAILLLGTACGRNELPPDGEVVVWSRMPPEVVEAAAQAVAEWNATNVTRLTLTVSDQERGDWWITASQRDLGGAGAVTYGGFGVRPYTWVNLEIWPERGSDVIAHELIHALGTDYHHHTATGIFAAQIDFDAPAQGCIDAAAVRAACDSVFCKYEPHPTCP